MNRNSGLKPEQDKDYLAIIQALGDDPSAVEHVLDLQRQIAPHVQIASTLPAVPGSATSRGGERTTIAPSPGPEPPGKVAITARTAPGKLLRETKTNFASIDDILSNPITQTRITKTPESQFSAGETDLPSDLSVVTQPQTADGVSERESTKLSGYADTSLPKGLSDEIVRLHNKADKGRLQQEAEMVAPLSTFKSSGPSTVSEDNSSTASFETAATRL